MPCFKGVAVSIHSTNGPIAEYSIQKQSRFSRITSYIPVPAPSVPVGSTTGQPEQATFAVSITLLVPGQRVPYSAPKPTQEEPWPQGRLVGPIPGSVDDYGNNGNTTGPYLPRTPSQNETLAAYIYFDGRPKEEVATLLRKGEETWVNSRWVSVPISEGGGLAEREFLFREVGLERWLNGLDLVGNDNMAATIEKRRKKMQRRSRHIKTEDMADMDAAGFGGSRSTRPKDNVLRYGEDMTSPTEDIDDDMSTDSDDEPPEPETTGQIRIALFRVLASGEVKKGEYQAQFDINDESAEQDGGGADVEHTTTLAKPKTLDAASISTQTVTGIDPPDMPYAVFTFLYRGEKQLQKMGIMNPVKVKPQTTNNSKRNTTDFSKLGPLRKDGTVGYSGYRENPQRNNDEDDAMDSDDEGDKNDNNDDPNTSSEMKLSPVDIRRQGEIAEGVRQIKLKRAHSNELLNETVRKSPKPNALGASPHNTSTMTNQAAIEDASAAYNNSINQSLIPTNANPVGAGIGISGTNLFASPFKKQRSSVEASQLGIPPSNLNQSRQDEEL